MRVGYSTVLVLPEGDDIEDFVTGMKESFGISGGRNFCYVRPIKANKEADLQLITAKGLSYSFLLREVSKDKGQPDIKVFVRRRDEVRPKPVSCDSDLPVKLKEAELRLASYQASEESKKAELEAARTELLTKVDPGQFMASVQNDYKLSHKIKGSPFSVTAIYHDGKFTYIKSLAEEKPALYEVKDGKPNLVNYDLREGVYIVPKIVDKGYLKVGKEKAEFERKASKS